MLGSLWGARRVQGGLWGAGGVYGVQGEGCEVLERGLWGTRGLVMGCRAVRGYMVGLGGTVWVGKHLERLGGAYRVLGVPGVIWGAIWVGEHLGGLLGVGGELFTLIS